MTYKGSITEMRDIVMGAGEEGRGAMLDGHGLKLALRRVLSVVPRVGGVGGGSRTLVNSRLCGSKARRTSNRLGEGQK